MSELLKTTSDNPKVLRIIKCVNEQYALGEVDMITGLVLRIYEICDDVDDLKDITYYYNRPLFYEHMEFSRSLFTDLIYRYMLRTCFLLHPQHNIIFNLDNELVDLDFVPLDLRITDCGYVEVKFEGDWLFAHKICRQIIDFNLNETEPVTDHYDGNRLNFHPSNLKTISRSLNTKNKLKHKVVNKIYANNHLNRQHMKQKGQDGTKKWYSQFGTSHIAKRYLEHDTVEWREKECFKSLIKQNQKKLAYPDSLSCSVDFFDDLNKYRCSYASDFILSRLYGQSNIKTNYEIKNFSMNYICLDAVCDINGLIENGFKTIDDFIIGTLNR